MHVGARRWVEPMQDVPLGQAGQGGPTGSNLISQAVIMSTPAPTHAPAHPPAVLRSMQWLLVACEICSLWNICFTVKQSPA